MKSPALFKKFLIMVALGGSLAACSERNPPRNENGSGLPGNEQREADEAEDGNHGDDDTRSEQEDRSN